MARNGSGTYTLPAGQPVVTLTTISSTTFNTLTSDLATALTNSLAANGETPCTARIPFANGISVVGDITTSATTFALINTTATTVNFAGGASTALNIGNASGTNTVLGATTFSQGVTLSSALTYGGVALSNAVTGTGNMVLSASPTLTGTLAAASGTFSGTLGVSGQVNLTRAAATTAVGIYQTGTTTGIHRNTIENTGSDSLIGVNNSAGTSSYTNATAYASFLGTSANVPLEFFTSYTMRLKIDGAGAVTIPGALEVSTGTGTIGWGTYTPTLTNTTNLAASTSYKATYIRNGNTVTVAGQVDIDPTAGGAILLGVSLPIASNFATGKELGGTASAFAVTEVFAIQGDSTNDRAQIQGVAVETANHQIAYQFTYEII